MRQLKIGCSCFASHLVRAILVFLLAASPCWAIEENERAPIEYSRSQPNNSVSRLQTRLDREETRLEYHDNQGYLRAVLAALEVPVDSQMLVFSKTSLQRDRITPRTPRAIYFNDQVYIGFCQSGTALEISVVDPQLGAVFYTLNQEQGEPPRFQRQTENCLICHSSSRTDGVPGHLARSLFVDAGGQPILSAGGYSVDHTTPFEKRWGGWYVTGKHGGQTHLGNLIIRGKNVPQPLDNSAGQNLTELTALVDVAPYLSPHSDIVALLVLEHQTFVQNRLTKANYTARQARHYADEMNRALGEPPSKKWESVERRIQYAGDDLVEALLMVEEAKLTAPVSGTSGFAKSFSKTGPHDSRGRSLRDLDLAARLFKYPCSYLIDSPAFDELPGVMKEYVWRRLWDVLTQHKDTAKFAHLSAEDRQAIVEILRATKRDLPEYWKATVEASVESTKSE